ncbi:MAG: ShlB/FhaC/HecB family hemolysin secretion/activation protein [Halanaerobium sp.]
MIKKNKYSLKMLKNYFKNISLIITLVVILIFFSSQFIYLQRTNAAEEVKFEVKKIAYNPSSILSEDELKEIIKNYEEKEVSISDLQEMVKEINQLYSEEGYITAKAILPQQRVNNGIIKVELIEGYIDKLILEGNSDTKDSYILNRMAVKSGDFLNVNTLEDDLFYFNATNDLMLRVELEAGEEYKSSNVIILAEESPKYRFSVFADNRGRQDTGEYRGGFSFSNQSLFGYRDQLGLSYFFTEGSDGGTLSYNFPISRKNSRVYLNYSDNTSEVIAGEYRTVNIGGSYNEISLGISSPIKVRAGEKKEAALEYKKKESENTFSDIQLKSTDIENLILNLSRQKASVRSSSSRYHRLVYGTADFNTGFFKNEREADEFLKYNYFFQWQKSFKQNDLFSFKTYLQFTADELLPIAEQISLGGGNSIRGYKEGYAAGDQGGYFSLQYKIPVNKRVSYYRFFDLGFVLPYKGNEENIDQEDYLFSTGLGINFNLKYSTAAEIVLGIPLEKDEDPRITFSIQKSW